MKRQNCAFDAIIAQMDKPEGSNRLNLSDEGVEIYHLSLRQKKVLESNVLEWDMVSSADKTTGYPYKTDGKIQQDMYLVLGPDKNGRKAWLITMVSRPTQDNIYKEIEKSKQGLLPIRILFQEGIVSRRGNRLNFIVTERIKIAQGKIKRKELIKHGYPMECDKNEQIKIQESLKIKKENLVYVFDSEDVN